jgi:hypothetical protein
MTAGAYSQPVPSTPLVSVIIPVFNASRFIEGALATVRAQTFRDYEVIIVDDGSTDDSVERARRAFPDALLLAQPNGGPARARNLAISRARGELLALLDADDEWFPNKLEAQLTYLERWPEARLVHHPVRGQWPFVSDTAAIDAEPPQHVFSDLLHFHISIRLSTVLVRRQLIDELSGFDERRELYVEDWDLWLRLTARYPVGWIARTLGYIRPGGGMSNAYERTYRGQQIVLEKLAQLVASTCAEHRGDPEACRRVSMHRLHHALGRDRLRAADRLGARASLERAMALAPLTPKLWLTHAATFLPQEALIRIYALKDRLAGRTRYARGD